MTNILPVRYPGIYPGKTSLNRFGTVYTLDVPGYIPGHDQDNRFLVPGYLDPGRTNITRFGYAGTRVHIYTLTHVRFFYLKNLAVRRAYGRFFLS